MMAGKSLKPLGDRKRISFNRKFGKRYAVKLLNLQSHVNPDGKCFFDVDFMFCSRMTAEEIGFMCENIALWLGGDLRGTLNIDFSGRYSHSLVVEMP